MADRWPALTGSVFEGNPSRRTFDQETGGVDVLADRGRVKPVRPTTAPNRFRRRNSPATQEALKRYKTRIGHAKDWRKKRGFDALWRRLIDMYGGKHFSDLAAEERIAVNIAFSTINVIFPSISINYPKFTVGARGPEDEERALITETVLNYQWKHYDFREESRRAVKDYLVLGHGWLKTGYRYVEEEVPLDDDEYQDQVAQLIGQADEYAEANPLDAAVVPTNDEIAASVPDTKMVAVEDRPFVERVSPFDIYVDPESTSMHDIKWIAQKLVRPLEDAKKDERYNRSARRKLKGTAFLDLNKKGEDDARRRPEDDKSPDVQRVVLWEFYDLAKKTVCVFADDCDEYLIDLQPMPYAFGHPFVMLRNYDIPDEFYPMGDLEALEPLQQELNALRSQSMNHRKRFARKYLYRRDAFGPEGRSAIESDVDNTFVPVESDDDFARLVAPMPITPLPPEFYQQSDQIEGDLDRVSGVNEYARGSLPEIRRTATEASIIADAANSRAQDKLAVIEVSLANCARRVIQLAQQYMTAVAVVRLVGDNGRPLWIPFERDDIMGEFDFEVEAGSTQPQNEMLRRQQAIELLNSMGQYVPMGVVNVQELLRHALQFGFGVKNPEKFLQVPPPMGMPPDPNDPNADPNAQQLPPEGGVPPDGAPPQGQAPIDGAGIPPELLAQLGM